MIRPLTCLCMLLAGGSGLYLYQEKHRTAEIDTEIEHVIKDIRAVKDQTALLRADWAVLNTPDRLGELAGRFLALKQTEPSQFVQYAELAGHLPPVAPPQADPAPEMDGDAPDAPPPASLPAVADAGEAATPVVEPASPVAMAAAAPSVHTDAPMRAETGTPARAKPAAVARPAHVAAKTVTLLASAGQMAPAALAPPVALNGPVAVARVATRPPALPRSLLARAETAANAPVVVTSAVALSRPVPPIGSALGTGRASLPPPVPISASYQAQ